MDFQKDFPILKSNVNGKPLIYFDNAATSQKLKYVINSINNYYQTIIQMFIGGTRIKSKSY